MTRIYTQLKATWKRIPCAANIDCSTIKPDLMRCEIARHLEKAVQRTGEYHED